MSDYHRCKNCGGRIVVEYLGNYGDVFQLRKDGKPCARRVKRFIYEPDWGTPINYCSQCGMFVSREEMKND